MTPNPYAPPAVTGLMDGSPPGYKDIGYAYVHTATILIAVPQQFNQWVPIDTSSDFVLRSVAYADLWLGGLAAIFNWRLRDSQGFELSNGLISSGNLSNNPAAPTPVVPELILPAGSSIGLDLENATLPLGGYNIQFQMIFRGVKRFRIRG